jgi:hypothetical protein
MRSVAQAFAAMSRFGISASIALLCRRCYMAVIRRVGPGSAFKIGLIVYALLGLVLGVFMAFISLVVGSLAPLSQSAAPGAQFFRFGTGLGAIIFFPIFYGVIGGAFAAIGAAVYNLVAGWVGGLEVEIN